MKTLYEAQVRAKDTLVHALRTHGAALDASQTGLGKTVVAGHVIAELGRPVGVICPKIVVPSWTRELKDAGVDPLFVVNYEKIRNGSTEWLGKKNKRMYDWKLPSDAILIIDEAHKCLPAGTAVSMADGSRRPIELVKAGEFVATPAGPRRVVKQWASGLKKLWLVQHSTGVLLSSNDHRIYVDNNWVRACDTEPGRFGLAENREAEDPGAHLRSVRGGSHSRTEVVRGVQAEAYRCSGCVDVRPLRDRVRAYSKQDKVPRYKLLWKELLFQLSGGAHDSGTAEETQREYDATGQRASSVRSEAREDARGYEPDERPSGEAKGFRLAGGYSKIAPVWRKWEGLDRPATGPVGSSTRRVARRVYGVGREDEAPNMAYYACGSRGATPEMGGGGGWSLPQCEERPGEGRPERCAPGGGRVAGFPDKERPGYGEPRVSGVRGTRILRSEPTGLMAPCFDLEVEEAECFFAEGLLVHNCKGERSQNAALHIAATKQGVATLNLSATAASAAPDMRALGFALGLHNDLGPKPGCPSYATWLRKNGSWQDPWRNWKPGPAKYLKDIHAAIFGGDIPKGVRLTVDDMPEAFKGNLVITDPIDFGSNVRKFYEDAGLTSDLVEHWLETGEAPEEEHFLTVVLRARQLAELHKIPATIEMTKDLLDEGKSVAIFMNFNDSIEALRIGFPDAAIVRGGQTGAEREAEVQRFQRDEARVVLLNSAAGGTGVSLHDLHGNYPRVSLISPSFSIFEHEQVLGRIYRNGAQSPALQRVLVASDSIEETVAKVLAGKKKSLDMLLSGV